MIRQKKACRAIVRDSQLCPPLLGAPLDLARSYKEGVQSDCEGIGVALHVLGDTLFDSVVDARHQGWRQEGVG